MNYSLVFLCICVWIFVIQQGDSSNSEELSNQDPHGSGVHQCRKCTLEFLKLGKAEQEIWSKFKFMEPEELTERFRTINKIPFHLIQLELDNLKLLNGMDNLIQEELNLVRWYFLDLGLGMAEMQDRMQTLYEKIGTIKAWQEYEKQLLEDFNQDITSHPNILEQIVMQESINLTNEERDEL